MNSFTGLTSQDLRKTRIAVHVGSKNGRARIAVRSGTAKEKPKSPLTKNQHTWRIGPVPGAATFDEVSQKNVVSRSTPASPTTTEPVTNSRNLLRLDSAFRPGRTINPNAIQTPLLNDRTYPLLQAAREWSLQANMLKHRAIGESLGDSWWREQLQSALQNPYVMHALLATGGSFAAIKTKHQDQSVILYHNVNSMKLLRQQLANSPSTLATLQTLVLLTAFEFYLGQSESAAVHIRAAGVIVGDLGGFRNIPWATKTFLISSILAISTKLKQKPLLPIAGWDEGPLELQSWAEHSLNGGLDWASTALLGLGDNSLTIEASFRTWHYYLRPTRQMFDILEYVQDPTSHGHGYKAALMQWIHNRRFVIKGRLLEQYVEALNHQESSITATGSFHSTLEACACLALTFCQSLIMFDVPHLLLVHEPVQQLHELLSNVYRDVLTYGLPCDQELLLWVGFIGAAAEVTISPTSLDNRSGHEQLWFSTVFMECVEALSMTKVDLLCTFGRFLWHERRLAPLFELIWAPAE